MPRYNYEEDDEKKRGGSSSSSSSSSGSSSDSYGYDDKINQALSSHDSQKWAPTTGNGGFSSSYGYDDRITSTLASRDSNKWFRVGNGYSGQYSGNQAGYGTRGSSGNNNGSGGRNYADDQPANATQALLQKKDDRYGLEGIAGIGNGQPDVTSDNWYSGDHPTSIDMAARIYALGGGDEMMSRVFEDRYTQGSANYHPYGSITSQACANLYALGVEIPEGGFTREYFEQALEKAAPYLKYSDTSGDPKTPGKRASKNEKVAYWLYKAAQDVERTDKAEAQLAAFKEEIAYKAGDKGRNLSDEEIMASIDWSKYDQLVKMGEDLKLQAPTEFTRVIDFSMDYIPGMIWAARNGGGTGNAFSDAVNARLNVGTLYQRDEERAELLNPGSNKYNPYAVGATMEDAGLYYGTYAFDDQWLEAHKGDRGSTDETRRKMYAKVYEANEFTKTCEAELSKLNTRIFGGKDETGEEVLPDIDSIVDDYKAYMAAGGDGEDPVKAYLDDLFAGSEFNHLGQLDDSLASGELKSTTRAIDYKRESFEAALRAVVEQKAGEEDAKTKSQKSGGILQGVGDFFTGIGDMISGMFGVKGNPEEIRPEPSKSGAQSFVKEEGPLTASRGEVVSDVGGQMAIRATPAPTVTPPPSQAGEKLQEEAQGNRDRSTETVTTYGTPAEKEDMLYTYAGADEDALVTKENISTGGLSPEKSAAYLHGAADTYAGQNYFGAAETVRQYEGLAQTKAQAEEELATLPEVEKPMTVDELTEAAARAYSAEDREAGDAYQARLQALIDADKEMEGSDEDVRAYERREQLQDIIARCDAEMQNLQGKYEEAQGTLQDVQDRYDREAEVRSLTGQEDGAQIRVTDVLDMMFEFANPPQVDWSGWSAYDLALQNGQDFETVSKQATAVMDQMMTGIAQIDMLERIINECGLNVPQQYLDNMHSTRTIMQRNAQEAVFLQARGQEDFADVAEKRIQEVLSTVDENGYYGVGGVTPLDLAMADPDKYGEWARERGYVAADLTKEERYTYFYLREKGGEEAAQTFYDFMADPVYGRTNARYAEERMAAAREFASQNGWNSFIATVGTSLSSPFANLMSSGQVLFNNLTGVATNPYASAFVPMLESSATRDEAKGKLVDWASNVSPVLGGLAGFAFDASVSAADSTVNGAFASMLGLTSLFGEGTTFLGFDLGKTANSFFGSAIMGAGAGAAEYRDVLARGGSEDQARTMAIISFAAETVTEAIELSDMLEAAGFASNAGEEAASGFLSYMKSNLPEFRNEFFGEAVGQAIESIADTNVMGDALSHRGENIRAYMAQLEKENPNINPEDARAQAERMADRDFWKEVLEAGVMGMVSAGISTSAAYAAGAVAGTNGQSAGPVAPVTTETQGAQQPAGPARPQQGELPSLDQMPTPEENRQAITNEVQANTQSEEQAGTANEAQEGTSQPAEQAGEETVAEAETQQPAQNGPAEPSAKATIKIIPVEQAGPFARQIAALTEAENSGDPRYQTTMLSGVLESMHGTGDTLIGETSAIAKALVQKIGGSKAAKLIGDLAIQAAKSDVPQANVRQAISVAALADGDTLSMITQGQVTAESLDAFVKQTEAMMQDPQTAAAIQQRITESRVAAEVTRQVEAGAMKDVEPIKRKAKKTRRRLRQARADYQSAVEQTDVANDEYVRAQRAKLDNPGDKSLQGAADHARKKLESANAVEAEYEKSVANAEAENNEAQRQAREQATAKLNELRANAQATVTQQQAQEQQRAEQREMRRQAQQQAAVGNEDTVYLDPTTPVGVHYELVPLDGLIVSNDENGNVNPDYPAELQPRDRTRAASRMDVDDKARQLNPNLLGANPNAQDGAPIVGPDYVVESGNGRSMALLQARNQNLPGWQAYQQWLRQNAAQFGFDPSEIPADGVLVRVRDTEVNRAEFARRANDATTTQMSPTETARADAEQLDDSILRAYDSNADMTSAGNRGFLTRFLQKVIPSSQLGAYIQKDGSINSSGLERIRNALFQRAFGSTQLTAALAEETDGDLQTMKAALTNMAPQLAQLRSAVENGTAYNFGLADVITQAAERYRQLKHSGQTVEDYLAQYAMPGVDPTSDAAKLLLPVFEQYKRSGKKLTRVLNGLVASVYAHGDPTQTSLLGPAQQINTEALITDSLRNTEQMFADEAAGIAPGQTRFDAETIETEANEDAARWVEANYPDASEEQREQLTQQYVQRYMQLAAQAYIAQNAAPAAAWRAGNEQRARSYAKQLEAHFPGLEVVFTDLGGPNGMYKDGKVYIDVQRAGQTDIFNRVLFHELTHHIEATGQYQQFQDLMLSMAFHTTYGQLLENMKNGTMTQADQELLASIQSKMYQYNNSGIADAHLDQDGAVQEIVADLTYKMFNGDQQAINDFVRAEPNLAQRILEKIKEFIQTLTGNTREPNEMQKRLQKAQELFEQALKERQQQANELESKYSLRDVQHDADTIRRNMEKVVKADPLIIISPAYNLKGRTLRTDVGEFFNRIGNSVESKVFGGVVLNNKGIQQSIGHGMTPLKAALYQMVPDIIRDGEMINYEDNWKGRGYDTAVLASPVEIKEGELKGEYYAGVVVNLYSDGHNRYYTHDGIAAIVNKKQTGAVLSTVADGGGRASTSLSLQSLLRQLLDVKPQSETQEYSLPETVGDIQEKTFPSLDIDRAIAFTGTDEQIAEAEQKEAERSGELERIITDDSFMAMEYTKPDGRKEILHISSRPGVAYQLTYIGSDGIPSMHESYGTAGENTTGEGIHSMDELYSHFIRENLDSDLNVRIQAADPSTRYSLAETDNKYLQAIESNDLDTAQQLVDQAAEAAMPDSKMRTKDGKLRKFYHGTNSDRFTVFDPKYIGTARDGDVGFFGRGFYFAYSEGEARAYGSRNVFEVYLDIKNPFNFQQQLNTLNGERSNDYNGSRAVFITNFAEQFPELADKHTVKLCDKGSDIIHEVSLSDFAKEFRRVYDTVEFKVEPIGTEWLVSADPHTESYTDRDGTVHSWTEYGFQQRYLTEQDAKNRLSNAYQYMANAMYSYLSLPNPVDIIQETDFSNAVQARGYDGIIQSEDGDEAVIFDSSQAKLADPMTQDDAGNVIPLSQRFNQQNQDIRYSLPATEADNQYLQAVENNDLDTAKQLVDQAAKAAGYNIPHVYHGTPAQFNQFSYEFLGSNGQDYGNGFYFTNDPSLAETYTADGGTVLEGALKIENPLSETEVTFTRKEIEEIIRKLDPTGDDILSNYESDGTGYPSKAWYNRALKTTVDSILNGNSNDVDIVGELTNIASAEDVLPAVRATGRDGIIHDGSADGYPNVYVVFESDQFKRTDPVTRDDAGNVIPLSQRFNPENKDIRYSLPADQIQPNRAVLPIDSQLQQEIDAAVERALAEREAKRAQNLEADERRSAEEAMRRVETYEKRKGLKLPSAEGAATYLFDDTLPLFKITERLMDQQKQRIEALQQKQRNGETLTDEEKAIIKRGVQGYDSSQDPRDLMLAKRNVVPNYLRTCVDGYMVDSHGERVMNEETGEYYGSLADITKDRVKQSEELEFMNYMLDLYGMERLRAGHPLFEGDTMEDLAARVADAQAMHQGWREAADELADWYGKFVQTWSIDSGAAGMRQTTFDNFRRMYRHYLPTFRQVDQSLTPIALQQRDANGNITTDRLSRLGALGEGAIKNPMVSLVQQMQQYMETAKQAEAMQAFDGFFSSQDGEATGWADLINEVPAKEDDGTITPGIMEAGSHFTWVSQDEEGNSILHVPMPDGRVRNWRCYDMGMINALTASEPGSRIPTWISKIMGPVGALTRFLCSMSTSRNINFSVQNYLSDGNTAVITGNTHGGLISYNIERLATMFNLMQQHRIEKTQGLEATSEAYQQFKLQADMGSPWSLRDPANARELRASLYGKDTTREGKAAARRQHWQEVGTLAGLAEAIGKPTGFVFGTIENLSDFLEETTRFNEWSRGHHDLTTYEGRIAAAKATREVTTDFSKHGTAEALAIYGKLVPFARAQMQGAYKTIRMFSQENAGNRAKYLGRIVFNTLLSSMVMEGLRQIDWDDEEKEAYEEMNAYEKMKYAHLKLPDGSIIRLKRSQDSIIQFANAVGETIMDLSTGYEDDDFAQLADYVGEIVGNLKPGTDTIFDAFIDAANNRTWYGGAIESSKYDGMATEDKYDDDTLGAFRFMSQHLPGDYSPLDWEYITQQYLGSAGRILIGLGQKGMGGELDLDEGLDIFGDEILGKLTYDPVYSSYASSEFYDSLSQLDAIQDVAKMGRTSSGYLRKDLTPSQFKAAAREAERLTGSGGQLAGIRKNISGCWKQYRKVQDNNSMSKAEKDEALRKIRDKINRYSLRGNTIIARYMSKYGRKSRKQQVAENVTQLLQDMGL